MEHKKSRQFDVSAGRLLFAGLGVFLLLFSVFTPLAQVRAADDPDDIEEDIDDLEAKLKKEEAKKTTLEQNLNRLDTYLRSTQAAIVKTQDAIRNTTDALEKKALEIQLLEQEIDYKKGVLRGLIQEMYFNGDKPLVHAVLAEASFSTVLDRASQTMTFQERVQGTLDEVQDLEAAAETERANLAAAKAEKERLLAQKKAEQQDLSADKAEVAEDLESQEKIVARLRKELAELQSDLAALTGKSYNAKDIKEAVEFASDRTGVPRGVLYGFLKMETNLGANTGQCTYKEVEKVAVARYKKYGSKYKSSIALLYKRMDIFYDLVDDLGYNKSKKVSCSPSGYIGQGGAMGVAQFMSDVWMGYRSQIASQTGRKNPDPWNLTDGVMAMALKLKKAGATSDSSSAIRRASINYLGAFNQRYYDGILYWSKNYKKLF